MRKEEGVDFTFFLIFAIGVRVYWCGIDTARMGFSVICYYTFLALCVCMSVAFVLELCGTGTCTSARTCRAP